MARRLSFSTFGVFFLICKLSASVYACPRSCHCSIFTGNMSKSFEFLNTHDYAVTCAGLGLNVFPNDIDSNVTHLYLDDNNLFHISSKMLAKFSKLKSLALSSNKISSIEDGSFDQLTQLNILDLSGNLISEITTTQFGNISSLKELILSDNPITKVAVGAFDQLGSLNSLHLSNTFVQVPPIFTVPSSIIHLYLDQTNIQRLSTESFKYYGKLQGLYLKNTPIKKLANRVFFHTKLLKQLLMEYSDLNVISKNAFEGLQLETLILEGTSINSLPSTGLDELIILNVRGVTNLWEIQPASLPNIRHMSVNYEFLCCPFKHREYEGTGEIGRGKGNIQKCKNATRKTFDVRTTARPKQGTTTRWLSEHDLIFVDANETMNPLTLDPCAVHILPSGAVVVQPSPSKTKVVCLPRPDDFNPCEDLLGSDGLRVCTWLVAISATIGNLLTLIVLLLNRRKVTNHKLLMCTLAFSNLCMGLYLLILASVDIGSKGQYNKHAKEWQHGIGCKTAGFLSIFSTELAVFTLNIITLERYYTIVYPLHQGRWITVRQTIILLVFSFIIALILAILPLNNVSSYSKVAICLPFDVGDTASKAYVSFLLISNGTSFFAVLFCYVKMYLSIQHSANASFSDLNIAKKMSLIVLTNFSCWAPVAVFSLIAIYGKPLIDVPTSKFLLVFVFPINAFTNPFLYILGTTRFQHDFRRLLAVCGLCLVNTKSKRSRREVATSVRITPRSYLMCLDCTRRPRSNSGMATVLTRASSQTRRTSKQTNSNDSQHSSTQKEFEQNSSLIQNKLPTQPVYELNGKHQTNNNTSCYSSSASDGGRRCYEMVENVPGIPNGHQSNCDDILLPNMDEVLTFGHSPESCNKTAMFESGC